MLGGLGVAGAVAIGTAFWMLWGVWRNAADSMDPAITASLANERVTMSAPSTTNVPIARDRAVAIAVNDFPNRKPDKSSAVLANVLVKPDPAYRPKPPSASQFQFWMRYHVAFIDAQSGKSEFAEESYFPVQPS